MFFFKKYKLYLIFFGLFFFSVCVALHQPLPLFQTQDTVWSDVSFYEEVLKDDWDSLVDEKKTSTLQDFIKKELAFVAAKQEGLFLHPKIKQKISNQRLFSLINATYKEKIAKPFIKTETVKINQKHLKTQVEAYHLLVGFSGSEQNTGAVISKKEAFEKADSLLDLINSDFISSKNIINSFKAVAAEFSLDPSAKTNQGFLGWVPWGQTVMSFQKPLFEGDFNFIMGPILTEYGYHLILKTNQKNSNFYYFSSSAYNDLSWVVAENSLSFDSLRLSAARLDSLLITQHGFKVNSSAVDLVLGAFLKKHKNNSSGFEKHLEKLRFSPLVLFVLDGQGFGVGWLVNKLKKVSASRVPYIEKREDLVSLLQTFALQDVVFRLGQAERVDSSSVFKRDFLKIKKDLIYNEYVKFLLSQISIPDSLTVAQKYNNSILSGMFIEPKRVVFSEIRVFDLAVAEDLNKKILSGQPFDYLLKQYGGSIKEPLSLGKNNPLTLEAFNLEVGSVSSIIKNNNGSFSIIRVESFLAETPFSLNRVYSQLERDLIVKKQEEIKENLFNFLVEKLGVSINFNVLGL